MRLWAGNQDHSVGESPAGSEATPSYWSESPGPVWRGPGQKVEARITEIKRRVYRELEPRVVGEYDSDPPAASGPRLAPGTSRAGCEDP